MLGNKMQQKKKSLPHGGGGGGDQLATGASNSNSPQGALQRTKGAWCDQAASQPADSLVHIGDVHRYTVLADWLRTGRGKAAQRDFLEEPRPIRSASSISPADG